VVEVAEGIVEVEVVGNVLDQVWVAVEVASKVEYVITFPPKSYPEFDVGDGVVDAPVVGSAPC